MMERKSAQIETGNKPALQKVINALQWLIFGSVSSRGVEAQSLWQGKR
tara:strand:+ start:320 stop:463 length:144 start_codon:yes stop_codon:yes gene_type:complete